MVPSSQEGYIEDCIKEIILDCKIGNAALMTLINRPNQARLAKHKVELQFTATLRRFSGYLVESTKQNPQQWCLRYFCWLMSVDAWYRDGNLMPFDQESLRCLRQLKRKAAHSKEKLGCNSMTQQK